MPEPTTEVVRVSKEVYDQIRQLAEAGYRSIGGQIKLLLDYYLEHEAAKEEAEA